MATQIGVNIGSGNGLLPDGTKPLPEPMLTLRSCGIHPKSITQGMLKTFILGMSFKIINLSSQLHLPGTSELKETTHPQLDLTNYTNPGYGLSLVDTLWNVGSYRQPLEQEGNPMT